jgi:hypothetical protein
VSRHEDGRLSALVDVVSGDELCRDLPEAFGVVEVECVGGDAGATGVRLVGVEDPRLVAVLEVAAADALE